MSDASCCRVEPLQPLRSLRLTVYNLSDEVAGVHHAASLENIRFRTEQSLSPLRCRQGRRRVQRPMQRPVCMLLITKCGGVAQVARATVS
jgi:hypothetical protein